MIALNTVHPNCYMVSKVLDMTPKGIIKLSLKQDDFDPSRDEPAFLLCDYYNDTGDIVVEKPTPDPLSPTSSTITYMVVNDDGELEPSIDFPILELGKTYYYSATFSDEGVDAQWRIILDGDYSDEDRAAIERLMVLHDIDDHTVSLRPAKSKKLGGLKFKLNVCDINGDYNSSIDVEVS